MVTACCDAGDILLDFEQNNTVKFQENRNFDEFNHHFFSYQKGMLVKLNGIY
jgi:hypothetical protein